MLSLYQFSPAWGLPNISPFCIKLETWLKMAGIEHRVVHENDPRKGPKGKIPYIVDDGVTMGDSTLIIEYLTEKYGVTLDDDLSDEQGAVAHAVQRMLQESLYWVLIQCRWLDDAGFSAVRAVLAPQIPAPLRAVLPGLFRRGIIKSAKGQGMGRHSRAEVLRMGVQDLDALAALLGDRPFLFGAEPHTVDANAFSFLMCFVGPPIHNEIKAHIQATPRLLDYYNRMRARYFPEVAAA